MFCSRSRFVLSWTRRRLARQPDIVLGGQGRVVEMGFELTLNGVPKKPRGKKITGADEARLIALACETKPDGHRSLRVLQEKFLSLENVSVDSVSHETIRKTLKKTTSSLGKGGSGASRQKPVRNS